ncbi:fimbrial protein [Mesorhizobium sp. CAU 1732]|uniref:fimbrial protein n=1 Tax=Mesorhizobium sp. CAU 1732 TaxID=3140358 RepID=UPI003261CBA3
MTAPNDDDEQDKPLDPAVERVRKRLVRFIVINLGILFIALMAVVIALVYRATQVSAPAGDAVAEIPGATGPVLPEGRIALPDGARIVDQSLSGSRISLHIEFGDGRSAIHLYDLTNGRIVGRYAISGEGE